MNIIYASLINDLFQYNNQWLYNVLRDGIYEKRDLEEKVVEQYTLDKNTIEKVVIYSNSFINTKYSLNDFIRLGYNIQPVQYLSMMDEIYEPAFSFQDQNKSLKNVYQTTGRKIDVCYDGCFISDLMSYEEHIKTMKFIKMFSCKYIDKIYIDFKISNYLKTRKSYSGREFTAEEKKKFIKEVKKITGKEVLEKKYMADLKDNEYDFGEYDFCFSGNTTGEGFKVFKNRKLVQKLHMSNSRSLLLGVRAGEKVIKKKI